ncbi:MAG: C40 family peptidase [Candidatus Marinimicrobia bacterium]|nr:C40 family peptidase [Candidatus Neomarinimicrobiota bacterium]
MKRLGFLALSLGISVLLNSCGHLDDVLQTIKEVEQTFAPDKRTAIFEVTAEKRGGEIVLKGETNLPNALKTLEANLLEKEISFINDINLLPDMEALDNQSWGIITVSVANIRVSPSNAAEMATQAILGTPVRLYKKNEREFYYYVQTPDRYLGWIDNNSVIPMNEETFQAWQQSERIIFLEDYGFVYDSPNEHSQRVSDIVAGNILEKTGKVGPYYEVKFPDGRKGFVSDTQAMDFNKWLKACQPTPENILETSYRFMGIPYLWGGTSTKMMDCSGFTKIVFFLNGLILPRDASQQVLEGTLLTEKVEDLSDVPPASLVFFGRHATDTSSWRVWHVGLWLGNGLMIHEDGPLKIESLNPNIEPFNKGRYETFYSARDFLNAIGEGNIIPICDHEWYNFKGK